MDSHHDLRDGYDLAKTTIQTCRLCTLNGTSTTSSWPLNDSHICGTIEPTVPLATRIVLAVILAIVILLSVVGNSIVCFIVHQKPPMRSAINMLLANMAMSHILLSLLCIPLTLTTLITGTWLFGPVMCQISAFLCALLVGESVTILLAISIDRYFITVRRKDMLTPTWAKRLLVLSWVFSFFIALPPTIGWGTYKYYPGWSQCVLGQYSSQADLAYVCLYYMIQYIMPAVLMVPAYLAILRNVRTQMRRVQNKPEQVATISGNPLATSSRLQQYSTTRVNIDVNLKAKSFKTILVLFITYLTCWMPYAFTLLTWNVQGRLVHNWLGGSMLVMIGYLNCAANPVIYCWRIKKFRDACVEIVPQSLKAFSSLPRRAKRRINPAAVYAT